MEHLHKDVMRTNLSELHVLPTLVDGKVVVMNSDKTYTLYKPFTTGEIRDGFNPIEYDLCQADFYTIHHVYELRWDNSAGKHLNTMVKSEKHHQYTTHRIGSASSENKRVAMARLQEKLVNQAYQEHLAQQSCDKCYSSPTAFKLRAGHKIHLNSKDGIYEVVSSDFYTITITCNKWQYTDTPTKIVSKSDFKCLAGGLHNWWK